MKGMGNWVYRVIRNQHGDPIWIDPSLEIPGELKACKGSGCEGKMGEWMLLVRMGNDGSPSWVQPGFFGELYKNPDDRGGLDD